MSEAKSPIGFKPVLEVRASFRLMIEIHVFGLTGVFFSVS
jgi:hypothetical protein